MDLKSYQDGRWIPLDVVDAFIIYLELVYQDLLAGEQLSLFATNVDRDCETKCVGDLIASLMWTGGDSSV